MKCWGYELFSDCFLFATKFYSFLISLSWIFFRKLYHPLPA